MWPSEAYVSVILAGHPEPEAGHKGSREPDVLKVCAEPAWRTPSSPQAVLFRLFLMLYSAARWAAIQSTLGVSSQEDPVLD